MGVHAFSRLGMPQVPMICRKIHKPHSFGIFYGANPLDYSFTLVLLEIIFVLLTSRVIRFLLKPLKQPRIVSDIIGGIFIGPSVLGGNKKFSSYMFPDNAEYVMKNIGIIGFMYFLFVTGVKMDLTLITKSGKKNWYIALVGVALPLIIVTIVAFFLRDSMDKDLAKISSIGIVASSFAITTFPVLYPILQELNLLSSEIGRMALSTAIISDAVGINALLAFEAAKQGEAQTIGALWYMVSLAVLMAFMVTCVRRVMEWIIEKTPAGQPVDQGYVVAILLGVCGIGFMTDLFGIAIANGPLWLGLVIPDGPPLGTTLVERCETIVMDILMPFSFAFVGLYTDVNTMSAAGWSSLGPMFAMAVVGYMSKMIGTLLPAIFFDLPLRDSLTLSLIMSLRGQVELILYIHWMDKLIIGQPCFTMLVLLTVVVTGIATPLISILYDPTRPYMVTQRRTIQHLPPGKELRTLLCIHDEETVAGFINLLEASNPSVTTPFSIFAIHLIELLGRAVPVFIDHELQEVPSQYSAYETIHNALRLYQASRRDFLKLHTFTAVAPKRSMYQDICKLAVANKATLIILPYHNDRLEHLGGSWVGVRYVNLNVLTHAPCSVGILVDKYNFQKPLSALSFHNCLHHFVVLFLGGADAREALVYADRMVKNRDVSLTVIRFLPYSSVGDVEMEKKLDDGVVTWFWVKNERNNRVVYKEVVVRNGYETMAAIHAMNHDSIELWIVGKQQGINPILLDELIDWRENQELGVIGDYVNSVEFGSSASVLVVQQQIMRGHGTLKCPGRFR
ncbi:cation/H(+) antiporter 24-like [Corylus avellana]|uniref:cation/H(+) antiporter 24-like n=1 Tax=Corylus avellana TaxID=13451 RepID=UPI001E20D0AF|nr:cation/H(+) antiporter 24-like [Corylus avellana]